MLSGRSKRVYLYSLRSTVTERHLAKQIVYVVVGYLGLGVLTVWLVLGVASAQTPYTSLKEEDYLKRFEEYFNTVHYEYKEKQQVLYETSQPQYPRLNDFALPQTSNRISAVLPLDNVLGKSLRNMSYMALYDTLRGQEEWLLSSHDSGDSRETAIQALRQALDYNTRTIIGPIRSSQTALAKQALEDTNIQIMSFSNDATLAGDNTYILGFTPQQQINYVLQFVIDKGLARIAIVVSNSEFGETIVQSVYDFMSERGVGSLKKIAWLNDDPKTYRGVLRDFTDYNKRSYARDRRLEELKGDKISNLNSPSPNVQLIEELEKRETFGELKYDVIILAVNDYNKLRTIAGLLKYYEVGNDNCQLVGLAGWSEYQEGPYNLAYEPTFIGSWHLDFGFKRWRKIASKYRETFSHMPPTIAYLAYEAMMYVMNPSQASIVFDEHNIAQHGYSMVEIYRKGRKPL